MEGKNMVTLCAVGDIAAFYRDPESAFEYVGPLLRGADITFAQNERHYSQRKNIVPKGVATELTSPKRAEALKLGGFDVISFASNHCMDLGADVMMETVNVLRNLGFNVIGAGRNIEEARRPVIIERQGTKVGFLAYASVIRPGYNAGPDTAGCAPMRARTRYHQIDYQPGTPPQIITTPNKADLQALIKNIKKLRTQVDLLALSLHWGVHFYHAAIAMYQKEVAHAAIDAGADIILGHHPHQLKGIEVYNGKPIFYSMGNFIFDRPPKELIRRRQESAHLTNLMDLYGWKPDLEWKFYSWPPESRKSMIVRCYIVDNKIQKVCFLPVLINQNAQPRVVPPEDKDFNDYFQYIKEITESQKLETEFTIEGNDIVVSLT